MNKIYHYIASCFIKKDEWLFITCIIAISLWQLNINVWSTYGEIAARNLTLALPIITFKVLQQQQLLVKHRLAQRILWGITFIMYPFVVYLITTPSYFNLDNLSNEVITVTIAVLLEVVLIVNVRLSLFKKHFFAPSNIGLDSLILAFLLFISCYAGMLITSDLPQWFTSNSVPSTINFEAVGQNISMAISLSAQLFLLFMCGYLFYWLNRHLLIKKVLKQRGIIIYALAAAATVITLYPLLMALYLLLPINDMAEPIIPAVGSDPFSWQNGRVFMAVIVLSLPIITVIEWHRKSNQYTELEKENIATELRLLKQQFDPHFFFNTLNNLYALSRKKSDQAPEVVLQLSQLMQYVVYRGQDSHVSIDEEISYINDYIALQSLRLSKKCTITFEQYIEDNHSPIAPLLLIILVENSFKHGIELASQDCKLALELQIIENKLVFNCKNSVEEVSDEAIITQGIGLNNLERRLELLYPNRHQLTLSRKKNEFSAQLLIDLSLQSNNGILADE